MGDHDALFKRVFGVPGHAAAELRSVLPAPIALAYDLSALDLVPASFVDAEMGHRHADLLFRAPLAAQGGTASGTGYLYVLLEHQSQPDPLMPWRVLTYVQRIWASLLRAEPRRRTLPPVVTVVVHHGEQGWTAPRRLHELVDGLAGQPALARFVPDLEIVVDDLASVDDDGLRARPMPPLPKVALWLLRDGRSIEAFLAHLVRWGDELDQLAREDPNPEDIALVVRYILRVAGEASFELLRERIAQAAPTFEEPMSSAAERLIQQGIQQGVERGHVEALRKALARQLRARFGTLDESTQRQIDAAPLAALERWIERVVTVANANDVFAPE